EDQRPGPRPHSPSRAVVLLEKRAHVCRQLQLVELLGGSAVRRELHVRQIHARRYIADLQFNRLNWTSFVRFNCARTASTMVCIIRSSLYAQNKACAVMTFCASSNVFG